MGKEQFRPFVPQEPEPTKKQLEAAEEGGLINDSSGKATEKARKDYKSQINKVDGGFYGHMNPGMMVNRRIRTSVKHIF